VRRNDELDAVTKELIERANFFGGTDNITAVLALVEDGEPLVIPDTPRAPAVESEPEELATTEPGTTKKS